MMTIVQQRRAERAADAIRFANARCRRLRASADHAERLYASMAKRALPHESPAVAAHRTSYLARLATHIAMLRQLADAAEMSVLWWEVFREWEPPMDDAAAVPESA